MTFSDLLIKKRNELHLSLREAAEKIGISHVYLDKLEKGIDPRTNTANKPTPDTLKLVAKAYNLDYYYLMELCGFIDSPKELDQLYICLLNEAREKGITPNDIENLISLLKLLKKGIDE